MTEHHEHIYEVSFPNHRIIQQKCYGCDQCQWMTRTKEGRYLVASVPDLLDVDGIYWRDMNQEERETYQELMDA